MNTEILNEVKDKTQPPVRDIVWFNTKFWQENSYWNLWSERVIFNIWTQSVQNILYVINAYRQNLMTLMLSGCLSLLYIFEQAKTEEKKSWKVSLRKAPSVNDSYIADYRFPSEHSVSFLRKRKQFKNPLENSCRPRIWRAFIIIVIVYGPAIAKCLQENLSMICSVYVHVSNKQMSLMPMESSAFVNDLLGSIMADLPKYNFWSWRHRFPLGCDGRVSKFPIRSLLLSVLSTSACRQMRWAWVFMTRTHTTRVQVNILFFLKLRMKTCRMG